MDLIIFDRELTHVTFAPSFGIVYVDVVVLFLLAQSHKSRHDYFIVILNRRILLRGANTTQDITKDSVSKHIN